MKILFVTRKFPPSVGGMELFARDLSEALSGEAELHVIKWSGSGRLKAVLFALPVLFGRAVWALLRRRIDIIHMQDGLLAPSGWLLSRAFRKPFVVVLHGLDITYKNALFRAMVPRAVAKADAVICISRSAAEAAEAAGVPLVKLVVIPLAANDGIRGLASRTDLLRQLGLANDSQLLLTVGRLVKRKGVAWFIENVLPELIKKYPKLVYLVAGDGEDRPNIKTAVQRAQMEPHVRLLGRTSPELLAAAYNGVDVFVMPNIKVPGDIEGFGLVLLEAALCERPVVAADFEGIRDAIVDGQNGRLVPSGDAASFNQAIAGFLANQAAATKFGVHARAYTLANYSWSQIAQKYLEIYQRLQSDSQNP